MKKETKANGVQGFLLYSPFTKDYFFRVYDPTDKSKFKDYDLRFEDMQIEIKDNFVALYEDEESDQRSLDYTSKVLGK